MCMRTGTSGATTIALCISCSLAKNEKYITWADPEGGGTGGPDHPWNCQIIDFCHVEIFRQIPYGNLDPPPPPEKIFWIRACIRTHILNIHSGTFQYRNTSDCYQWKEMTSKKTCILQYYAVSDIFLVSMATFSVIIFRCTPLTCELPHQKTNNLRS